MAQLKVRKGNIVETTDGSTGMIVYRKGNDTIGINSGHYHTISNITHKDKSFEQQRDATYLFGADKIVSIEQIAKVLRDNSVYN